MNHGLGISVMEELLGNNMGSLETVWDDNFFYLRILRDNNKCDKLHWKTKVC